MRELLTQEMLVEKKSLIDKRQENLKKEEEKLNNFKVKEYAKAEKNYINSKASVEKVLAKYKTKLAKAQAKYSSDDIMDKELLENVSKFCNSKIAYYTESLDMVNKDFELAKQDIDEGVRKASELKVKLIVNSAYVKYDKINFNLNKNEIKAKYSNKEENIKNKENYKQELTKLDSVKTESNNKVKSLKAEFNNAVKELNVKFKAELSQTKSANQAKTKEEKTEFHDKINLIKIKHSEDLSKLKVVYHNKIRDERASFNKKLTDLRVKYNFKNMSYKKDLWDAYNGGEKLYTPGFVKRDHLKATYRDKIKKIVANFNSNFAVAKNMGLKDWIVSRVWGIPMYMLIAFSAVIVLVMCFDKAHNSIVYPIAILLMIAIVSGVIFEKIPVFNKYMGGAVIGCMLLGAALVYTNVIEKGYSVYNAIDNFFSDSKGTKSDFLDFYISFLLIGSIVGVNRKVILKSFSGFMIIVVIGTLGSSLFGILGSLLVGKSLKDGLLNYLLPILCAGNGGGIQPIDTIAKSHGINDWQSNAQAISALASIISIVIAAVLASLGKVKVSWSGEGQLMKRDIHTSGRKVKLDHRKIAVAVLLVSIIFIVSTFISDMVNTKSLLGFNIPNYVYIVFICLFLNVFGVIPADLISAAQECNKWVAKQTTWLLMIAVGVLLIDLNQFVQALTFQSVFICLMFVLGTTITIMLISKIFKMNQIEAALTGGLCMTAQGGTGVVSVLGVADRMELMAFGQITCRIAGSLIIVVAGVLFGIYS